MRVKAIAHLKLAPLGNTPKQGQPVQLPDGRLGVLSAVLGNRATVKVFDLKTRKAVAVVVELAKLKRFESYPPSSPNTTRHPKARKQAETWVAGSQQDYPKLQGKMSQLEVVVHPGRDWMDYNCIANSLRKYNDFIYPCPSMKEQDALYAKHGFVPVEGTPTPEMLKPQRGVEKILLYALPDNPGRPRHAIVMDSDGLWNSKMGQGPHLKLADPLLLNGADAGVPVRLYVKAKPLNG